MTENINVDVEETYEFNLVSETDNDYRITKHIAEWLQRNMIQLQDTNDNTIFSKVNYGYNESTIKGFGKKPVCDVYINGLGYSSDLNSNRPETVTSFIICYVKGNMNNAYLKACELTDYLLQGFETNEDWRELVITEDDIENRIVRDTYVRNVRLQIIPSSKTYGVLCAFELEHKLYEGRIL